VAHKKVREQLPAASCQSQGVGLLRGSPLQPGLPAGRGHTSPELLTVLSCRRVGQTCPGFRRSQLGDVICGRYHRPVGLTTMSRVSAGRCYMWSVSSSGLLTTIFRTSVDMAVKT
jgi:hypothetical protein